MSGQSVQERNAVRDSGTLPAVASEEVRAFLETLIDIESPSTRILATTAVEDVEGMPENPPLGTIINLKKINDARHMNRLLRAANRRLPPDGALVICGETLGQRKARMRRESSTPAFYLRYALQFLGKRIAPKLLGTKQVYFQLTKGRDRVLSETELLGRLLYCGFGFVETREIDQLLYVVTRKRHEPLDERGRSYGPLFKMARLGQHGAIIHVYKLRTMHPYAEYLQEYVYEQNKLAGHGKFKDDFRITGWGGFLRRWWLDEFPMIVNWLKRDLKLVGVRPLSVHYASLYPPELRVRRQRFKPGLIPPYYADVPDSFEAILRSEEEYLRSYEQKPLRTDCRYFFTAMHNILIGRARSR